MVNWLWVDAFVANQATLTILYFPIIINVKKIICILFFTIPASTITIDKKWFFKSWSINAYIDIENILNAKRQLPSEYGIDPNLGPLVEGTGENSESYPLYEIINNSGTVLPSIGLLIEF